MKSVPALSFAAVLAAGLASPVLAQPSCPLTNGSGPIKHVVYLQFDNTHFDRDRANIPSDLEQMPALLSFLQTKGTLLSNDHTQLASHTANGILTSITGVYPDRHGQGVANSYDYYKPDGSTAFTSSFVYWTNKVQTTDTSAGSDQTYSLINELGNNAPAPWAAYTKAGCDFGAVALADMELENTSADIINVFGAGSPQAGETSAQKVADFEGIAIHCAQNSPLCSTANGGRADILPQEPGGYVGFNALFGHKYAVPAVNGGQYALKDLLGGTINGFPGFDGMFTKVTLAYTAQMLEAGVPVVYGYLSDAHDNHVPSNMAYGPGEAGYVAQLQQYNAGWAAFFARLKSDGIDETNTLFVVTVEEGDHFVGGQQSPANCDGVTIACTYAQKGEVDLDLGRVVSTLRGNTTKFDVHFDMAPNTYVAGNPPPENATVRQLEHDFMALAVPDPALNNRTVPVMVAIADQVEQKILHITAADPLRVPTFTPFGYQDFYMTTSGSTLCPTIQTCVFEAPAFAWNHGGIQAQIAKTWFGMIGPGVLNRGVDNVTWTDHVDFRPTILMLAGIKDSYLHDGRVIVENLDPSVLPPAIAANLSAYEQLAAAYKQLTAPFGAAGMASLTVSTRGVALTDPAAYQAYEASMQQFLSNQTALVSQIKTYIDAAAFAGGPFDAATASNLTQLANALTAQMQANAN